MKFNFFPKMNTKLVNIFFLLAVILISLSAINSSAATNEPLPPEKVFQLSAKYNQAKNQIEVNYKIADGYYLYRNKTTVRTLKENNHLILPAITPQGIDHQDEFFGATEIYRGLLTFTVPAQNLLTPIDLLISVQGCADFGICYPPFEQLLKVNNNGEITSPDGGSNISSNNLSNNFLNVLSKSPENNQIEKLNVAPVIQKIDKDSESETDKLAREIAEKNILVLILIFLGLGILLSLSPCNLPLVPILAALIAEENNLAKNRHTPKGKFKNFFLASAFVLGTSITYALVGTVAGFTGSLITTTLQLPIVQIFAALIMLILAGSCFGIYHLQMPAFIQNFFRAHADKNSQGFIRLIVAGAVSALLIGPCVAAPLIAVLIYIGQSGSAIIGALLLFILAWGQGFPLLLYGIFSDRAMPKLGAWMNSINHFFGFLLIFVAVWLISPLVSSFWVFMLYGAVLIFAGVYLDVFTMLPHKSSTIQKLFKALGILILIYGVSLIIGGFSGNSNLLKPLEKNLSINSNINNNSQNPALIVWHKLDTVTELNSILANLQNSDKPTLLKFSAKWCVSCVEFEAITFPVPEVQNLLTKFNVIAVDVTNNNLDSKTLLKNYNLFGPPAFIFIYKNTEIRAQRLIGVESTTNFISRLNSVLENIK